MFTANCALGKLSSTDRLLESLDLVFKDLDKIYLLLSYMGTPPWVFFRHFLKWEQLQWLSICFPERRGGSSLKGKSLLFVPICKNLSPVKKGGKNVNRRIASSESTERNN